MRRIGIALALALALVALCAAPATAEAPLPAGFVVVNSVHDMPETERRLRAALDAAGLKVAARIDHGANAESVGLSLPPTVLLVFGNPKAGTPLMQASRLAGLDLPLKALIYTDDGAVRLAYTAPAEIARRHGLPADSPAIAGMTQALAKFTDAATAP